jgi:hypothetical protein
MSAPNQNHTITAIVTEAVALDREIRDLTRRLKELKAHLITEATARPLAEHVATDGGGSSWIANGADGCVARVTFPGPQLKSSIDPSTKTGEKLLTMFGDAVKSLFRKHVVYKPVDDFRTIVEQEFTPRQAEKLIAACESERAPSVSFETKDSAHDL